MLKKETIKYRGRIVSKPPRAMTVCIAAAYREPDHRPGVVLCCDWRVEAGVASSESCDKLAFVKHGWPTLISDSVDAADRLIEVCIETLASITLTASNVQAQLEIAAQERIQQIRHHHLMMKWSMSLGKFWEYSKMTPSPDWLLAMKDEIEKLELGAFLLVSGCIDDGAHILRLQSDGEVFAFDNSAASAIGEGDGLAEAWLHWRKHEDNATLLDAIYNVYEAKRFAEMVGSVGTTYTSVYVLKPDQQVYSLTKTARDHLKARYADFHTGGTFPGRDLPDDLLDPDPVETGL